MPPRFDPQALLPPRLQSRIDSWYSSPPSSQFSMYGPLNAYLQGHKFPSDMYLVKPQSKVQGETAEMDVDTDEEEEVEMDVGPDEETEEDEEDEDEDKDEDEEVEDEGNNEEEEENSDNDNDDDDDDDQMDDSDDSDDPAPQARGHRHVDSYDVSVTDLTRYLDFTVCQYFGDHKTRPDILRIVIEIGSDKNTIKNQVQENLDIAGPSRWDGEVLGIGIVKNKVWMVRNKDPVGDMRQCYGGRWLSLYGVHLINELDRVKAYSEAHD